jgi:hypothetical protein
MRVEVRPLNVSGRPLSRAEHQRLPASVGKLKVHEKRSSKLDRIVLCATLTSVSDGLETELLPELGEAQLIWADDGVMRIRGIEVLERTQYAQTWVVKVL